MKKELISKKVKKTLRKIKYNDLFLAILISIGCSCMLIYSFYIAYITNNPIYGVLSIAFLTFTTAAITVALTIKKELNDRTDELDGLGE